MAETMQIELTDNSALVQEEMLFAALRALEKCGLAAERYAKRLCPVDTGNLRNSITHRVDEGGAAAYVGTNSEYAAHVELGTGKYCPGGRKTPWVYRDARGRWHITHGQRAQPYLRPAVAGHAAEYRQLLEDGLRG